MPFIIPCLQKYLKSKNTFLEEKAVVLCNIKPDFEVLEVGFGPGTGLKTAAQYVGKSKSFIHVGIYHQLKITIVQSIVLLLALNVSLCPIIWYVHIIRI